ncbi:hypothetical protein WA158_001308 [Blastocystis sp. Blastoise]
MKGSLSLYAPVETLIDMMKQKDVSDVLRIMDDTLIPYKSSEYAQVIRQCKDSKDVEKLIQSAGRHNIYLDYEMCSASLDVFYQLKDCESAEKIFNMYQSQQSGNYNSYLCNMLLKIYDVTNSYKNAQQLVDRICESGRSPSTTSYTLLLFLLLKNGQWKDVQKTLLNMKSYSMFIPVSLSVQILDYYYRSNEEIPPEIYSCLHIENSGVSVDNYLKSFDSCLKEGKSEDILNFYKKLSSLHIHIEDMNRIYKIEEAINNVYKGLPLPSSLSSQKDFPYALYSIRSFVSNNQWKEAFDYITDYSVSSSKEINDKYQSILFSSFLSRFYTSSSLSSSDYDALLLSIGTCHISLTQELYERVFSSCATSSGPHITDTLDLYKKMKNNQITPSPIIFTSLFNILKRNPMPFSAVTDIYLDFITAPIDRTRSLYVHMLPLLLEPSMTFFPRVIADMEKDKNSVDSDIYHIIFDGFLKNKKYIEGIQYYIKNSRNIHTDEKIKIDVMKCSLYSRDEKMLMATVTNICQSPYESIYSFVYSGFKEVIDMLCKRDSRDVYKKFFNVISDSSLSKNSNVSFPNYIVQNYKPKELSFNFRSLIWEYYSNQNLTVSASKGKNNHELYIKMISFCPFLNNSLTSVISSIENTYSRIPPISFLQTLSNYYINSREYINLITLTTLFYSNYKQIYLPGVLFCLSSFIYNNNVKDSDIFINTFIPSSSSSSSSSSNTNNSDHNSSTTSNSNISTTDNNKNNKTILNNNNSPSSLPNELIVYIASFYAYNNQNTKLESILKQYPSIHVNNSLFRGNSDYFIKQNTNYVKSNDKYTKNKQNRKYNKYNKNDNYIYKTNNKNDNSIISTANKSNDMSSNMSSQSSSSSSISSSTTFTPITTTNNNTSSNGTSTYTKYEDSNYPSKQYQKKSQKYKNKSSSWTNKSQKKPYIESTKGN